MSNFEIKNNRGSFEGKSVEVMLEELNLTKSALFELKLSKSRGLEEGFYSKYKILKKNVTRLQYAISHKRKSDQVKEMIEYFKKHFDAEEKNNNTVQNDGKE